jgi:hypothetical protein
MPCMYELTQGAVRVEHELRPPCHAPPHTQDCARKWSGDRGNCSYALNAKLRVAYQSKCQSYGSDDFRLGIMQVGHVVLLLVLSLSEHERVSAAGLPGIAHAASI